MRSASERLRFTIALLVAVGAILCALASGQSVALAVPANDDFPGQTIDAVPFETTVDTTGATLETDEPIADCGPAMSTAWWSFTPSETAVYVLQWDAAGDFAPMFVVWEESSFGGGGLSELICGGIPPFPDFPPETSPRGSFQGEAGKTYYIQLGGFDDFWFDSTFAGPVDLTVTQAVRPANDNFADATEIAGFPFLDSVDITGATTESDELQAPCTFDEEFGVSLAETVWYKFTAPEDKVVVIEMPATEAYATVVVWDMAGGTPYNVGCGGPVGLSAKAGHTYYVQVGELTFEEYPVLGGTVELSFEYADLPECAGPTQQFTDPLGDVSFIDPEPQPQGTATTPGDVINIDASVNSEWACLTFQFAEPLIVDPTEARDFVYAVMYIDTDQNIFTGFPASPEAPCTGDPHGIDLFAQISNSSNLVTSLIDLSDVDSREYVYGFQIVSGDSITLAIPAELMGDDQAFTAHGDTFSGLSALDCLPNEGQLYVKTPTKAAFGDVNCDGLLNGLDVAEILSMVAGARLPSHSGCTRIGTALPSVFPASGAARLSGDVNCDGILDALDALGLLREVALVPGERPSGCPVVGDAPLG